MQKLLRKDVVGDSVKYLAEVKLYSIHCSHLCSQLWHHRRLSNRSSIISPSQIHTNYYLIRQSHFLQLLEGGIQNPLYHHIPRDKVRLIGQWFPCPLSCPFEDWSAIDFPTIFRHLFSFPWPFKDHFCQLPQYLHKNLSGPMNLCTLILPRSFNGLPFNYKMKMILFYKK